MPVGSSFVLYLEKDVFNVRAFPFATEKQDVTMERIISLPSCFSVFSGFLLMARVSRRGWLWLPNKYLRFACQGWYFIVNWVIPFDNPVLQ